MLWAAMLMVLLAVVLALMQSAQTLGTEIMLRSSEEWALKRYLNTEALETVENSNLPYLRRWRIYWP
jgi:hypothetical protein